MAGTRAQSCDRYGSGTLHPGHVLGGSLPLLSPAFRRSHFSRQVPSSATTREILAANGRERCPIVILPKFRLPRIFRDLLRAANLRHGTDGFTSPSEGRRAEDFFALKIRRLQPGLNAQTWVLQHATPRPSKASTSTSSRLRARNAYEILLEGTRPIQTHDVHGGGHKKPI